MSRSTQRIKAAYCRAKRRCSAALIGLAILMCLPTSMATETVTLAVGHWPPYINQARPGEGILTRKVVAVYQSMGIQPELLFDGWLVVGDRLLLKENFVSYGWVKNEQRLQRWHFSEPIGRVSSGFWVRNGFNQIITDYQQLDQFLIGVGKGYSYGQEFEDNKHRFKQADFVAEGEGFRLLMKGRIDVFISDLLVGEYFLSRHKSWRQRIYFQESPLLGEVSLHLICVKTAPWCHDHIAAFNRALRQFNTQHASQVSGAGRRGG